MVEDNHPQIVELVEPRISGHVGDNVIAKLGFHNTYRIETNGFSRGLWLLWDDSIKLTVVYASPSISCRKHLWGHLEGLKPIDDTPWVLGKDFNVLLADDEQTAFHWVCGNLHQRLDLCLVNECWFDYYNEALVQHLDWLGSDHRTLLLCLMDVEKVHMNRSFLFKLACQQHSQFSDFMQTTWACDGDLVANLDSFRTKIEEWNVDTFGHIGPRKRCIRSRLCGTENSLMRRHSDLLLDLYF
ncbi:hypothetical protein V6N13_055032 [Hibiscus sabdariffa]